jgi:UDP-2,3-diacylglucosamine pyrophosphatase LpxH
VEGTELAGRKRYLVAVSDVHLGTLVPTVWYQPEVHEPNLLRLLHWVRDHAEAVRELVLLGDIVELWTYPANVVPPTFADIVDAHPNVLGPDGALAELLDVLDGAVTYVPGNHDQGVTAEELAVVRGRTTGHPLRLVEDVPYLPAPRLAVAHGHHWTLFNAPATTGPWAPLPIGYFVTRAVATRWAADLTDGRTVADLGGQGAPNGIDLASLRSVVSGAGARSVAASLLDFVAGATGLGLDLEIQMPGGGTVELTDVRHAFADVWSEWAEREGGGLVGQTSAARAAAADFDGTGLGWFAQRLGLQHDADLVVMGHTHLPIGGLAGGAVDYLNTGFDCPSGPDLTREHDPQQMTFGVIDLGDDGATPTGRVWAVDATGCHPIDAPTTPVVPRPLQDYSCYVTLDNGAGTSDLELVAAEAQHGHWVVDPPDRLAAGSVARCWLQDQLGTAGSAGSATYRRLDTGETVTVRFSCPVVGTNDCEAPGSFATRAGEEPWREERVAYWGHPLFIDAQT